jgi:predicted RNase H-like HicB family nuclease
MRHPSWLVNRYRIVLERAEDQTLVARCVEVPGPSARALNVDAAVAALRDTLAGEVAALSARGDAPAPLRESEGRLAAWMRDLELLPEPRPRALVTVEKPLPSSMHAIAKWTIDRYRIVLEEDEVEGFVATSPEMPDLAGYGVTASGAAADLRERLEGRAFQILNDNRVPPEPMQDIEKRLHRKPTEVRPAMALAA